jgi:hypothetical protein
MTLWRVAFSEIAHRPWSSATAWLGVAAAVAATVSVLGTLRVQETRSERTLAAGEAEVRRRLESVEEDVRRAMARLGATLTIIPEGQSLGDWFAEDYAAKTMPEAFFDRLVAARPSTLDPLTPQLRRRARWPETGWTVIVVGRRAPRAGAESAGSRTSSCTAGPGEACVGHEIHRGLGLKPGASFRLMDRAFQVRECLPETGSRDDITLWLDLGDAQALFGCRGQINEILAAATEASWKRPDGPREEVAAALPGTQVIEDRSKLLAEKLARLHSAQQAAEALQGERRGRRALRSERQRAAWALSGVVLLLGAAWMGLLAARNVRERRQEIGLWRALGLTSGRLACLFAARWLVLGGIGVAAGVAVGISVAAGTARSVLGGEGTAGSFPMDRFAGGDTAAVMAAALALTVALAAVTAAAAARQDPAAVLHEE